MTPAEESTPAPPATPRTFGGASHAWRALRHRNFRLFFGGQSISLIGTWMTRIATAWLVYRLTGSAMLLGTVSFAGQIPTFLVAPFAGVWVDRLNRRQLLVWTQTASMLQSRKGWNLWQAKLTVPSSMAEPVRRCKSKSMEMRVKKCPPVQIAEATEEEAEVAMAEGAPGMGSAAEGARRGGLAGKLLGRGSRDRSLVVR